MCKFNSRVNSCEDACKTPLALVRTCRLKCVYIHSAAWLDGLLKERLARKVPPRLSTCQQLQRHVCG
ncbi:TPA: hypothetical protein ACH3X2_001207 [Trebouxia sp. C0005]